MPKKKNGSRPVLDGIPEKLFVAHSKLPEMLLCSICLETTNQPVYTPCGHFFCAICMSKVKDMADDVSFECPNCRTECYYYAEAEVARTILASAPVYCSEIEDKRCGWTGPLRMLAPHLESGCSKSRMADRARGRKTETIGHKSFRRSELDKLSEVRLKDVIGKILKNDEMKERRAELIELPSEKEDLLKLACEVLDLPYDEEEKEEKSEVSGIVYGVTADELSDMGEEPLRRWLSIRHSKHDYIRTLDDLVSLVLHCLRVFDTGHSYSFNMERKGPIISHPTLKHLLDESEKKKTDDSVGVACSSSVHT